MQNQLPSGNAPEPLGKAPQSDASATLQQEAPAGPATNQPQTAPTEGRRQPFQDIRRQLTTEEMTSPGTSKLILEMLFAAEDARDEYKAYVELYHSAEKKAAVLDEQIRCSRTNEILFSVGLGVGCAIIGLAPFFYDVNKDKGLTYSIICLAIGCVLTAVSAVCRIFHK